MSGIGKDGGGIITNPFVPIPFIPSQPTVISDPSPTNPAPVIPTPGIPTTPSIVPTQITLSKIITITKENPSLPAQSTVRPRNSATITSTISVPNAQANTNANTTSIAAIIFGILVGLVIVGGSISIFLLRKFSKNKRNKKNQTQPPSIDENVHNNVPTTELPERISDDNQQMSQRNSLLYFHPQFPLPPPRHPLHQNPLPQHSPQHPRYSPQNPPTDLYMNSPTGNYSSEPPLSEHSVYAGAIPNHYQRYSQLQLPTATEVISSHNEQSQSSSTEIP